MNKNVILPENCTQLHIIYEKGSKKIEPIALELVNILYGGVTCTIF